MVELGAAGKSKHISYQWVLRYIFNRNGGFLSQWMVFIDYNAAIPVIARQHYQIVVQMQRLGSYCKVCFAFGGQITDLRRRALVHMQ